MESNFENTSLLKYYSVQENSQFPERTMSEPTQEFSKITQIKAKRIKKKQENQKNNYCYSAYDDNLIYQSILQTSQKEKVKQKISIEINRTYSAVQNRFYFLSTIDQTDLKNLTIFVQKNQQLSKGLCLRFKPLSLEEMLEQKNPNVKLKITGLVKLEGINKQQKYLRFTQYKLTDQPINQQTLFKKINEPEEETTFNQTNRNILIQENQSTKIDSYKSNITDQVYSTGVSLHKKFQFLVNLSKFNQDSEIQLSMIFYQLIKYIQSISKIDLEQIINLMQVNKKKQINMRHFIDQVIEWRQLKIQRDSEQNLIF